ncbi:MAG: ATPase [Alphaproteobacteria bacterium]|nr:ATPase [Alphaproteobacteria bacterium]MDE2014665.1 ATPase [Alphaproteobacteria bacterium]MDE2075134.1 ATPase [Alphaproteobacteria bacterium]MDE2352872.1 ATPase [Alphaproteobacteria bacterium]
MTQRKHKRFYKNVSVGEREGGFVVLLDGKPLKTPSRSAYALPRRALAEAVAEEWRGQGEQIDPDTMPITRLANTAMERVPASRAPVAEQALALGRSDLLCYRADTAPELAARQAAAWDPLLDWLAERYGAKLRTGAGITFVEQPAAALAALRRTVEQLDDFALTGLSAAAAILGSLVLALALSEGRIDAAEAMRLATLDEVFQSERWGVDAEAQARLDRLGAELAAVERFLRLIRA